MHLIQNRKDKLRERISFGESEMLDFKFEISDSRKIARSICAFSNTKGGSLLVGVKDNGAIAGIRSEEEMYMVEAAAQLYCKPEIDFEAKLWRIDKKDVMEVVIAPLISKGCRSEEKDGKWLSWIRVKDQNILAPSVIRKVWKLQQTQENITISYNEPLENLIKMLKEKDKITLSFFSRTAIVPYKYAEELFAKLVMLKILNTEINEKGSFFSLTENSEEELKLISK